MAVAMRQHRPHAVEMLLALALSASLTAACSTEPGQAASSGRPSRTIENKGSDTIVNLALAWAEAYQQVQPAVQVSVTGGGTGTGMAALINGTVDIANASRRIKPEERSAAEANGISPVEFVVARDAIAVIVHPDNPVDRLTIDQIAAVYTGAIDNWVQLGGQDRPIVRLSRETNSGTHVYFLEQVLRKGDPESEALFSPDTLLLPSSEGITAEVRDNPNAIGYDGLGYVTPDVKVLAVALDPGLGYAYPTIQTVNSLEYPIARELYMYTAGEPESEVLEYLNWILGDAAQVIVSQLGFVPARR
jgi:phosphate transport system substrate-binding protein